MIFPTENPTFSLLLVSAFIKDGIAMFLERKKRTPTAIYITFVCMTAIVWYLGFWEDVFIFTVLFFWWLMLCFILLSRYGSRRLLVIQGKYQLAIHTNEPFRILHRKLIGLIFLISLPFYYFWFLISFLACMNGYFFIILNLPILTFSCLVFRCVFLVWRSLETSSGIFWGMHIGMYILIQFLGWIIRATLLSEFYI